MRDSKNLVIGMLCAVICVMAVAYAAFSTTLTINGTATISSEWSVGLYNNAQVVKCVATPKTGGQTGANGTITAYSDRDTSAQFDVEFIQPGDTVTCTVQIKNFGNINAKVNNLVVEIDGSAVNGDLPTNTPIVWSYTGIANNTTLDADAVISVAVTATLNDDVVTSSGPNATNYSTKYSSTFKLTPTFVENK